MPSRSNQATSWTHAWYAVAFLRDLDPKRPTPFTLMGEDLVLWFERSSGQWTPQRGR
jgi:phenylpropionate dioxygenase-like ring-hydroxylating dioxygenase large terminal subunit